MREHALGEVFRARDFVGRSFFLVKELRIAKNIPAENEAAIRALFLADGERLRTVRSPFSLPVIEISAAKPRECRIVMPDPGGTPLAEALRAGRRISGERLRYTASAIASICGALAQAGLERWNILPSSYFQDGSGRIKYVDMHFAPFEVCEQALPGRLWPEDSRFLSPEQLQGERGGPVSQVFSLGVFLHLLICGRTPFDATTPEATRNLLLNTEPPSILRIQPDLPPDLAEAIDLSLSRDPAGRPQSLEEFMAAAGLEYLEEEPVAVDPERDAKPVDNESRQASERRLRWIIVAALGAALALVAYFAFAS